MKYAIACSSVIPMRSEPSEKAEMITQIMFGEHVEILDTQEHWARIRNGYDGYEGWIDKKTLIEISETEFIDLKIKSEPYVFPSLFGYAIDETKSAYLIPAGCTLPKFNQEELSFRIGKKQFCLSQQPASRGDNAREIVVNSAHTFLNTPYLWGGKNPFGIDCSGLVQICYKIAGIQLPRDAHQQVKTGIPVNFLENAKPGDLAFFDNDEGKIIHVGILLNTNTIIHSSGKVHIDPIDNHGIVNSEAKKYSHKLRLITNVIG